MFRTHKLFSIFALFALLLTTGCPSDTEGEGGEGEESGEAEGSAEGEAEGEGEGEAEEGEAEEGGEEAAAGGLASQFEGTWNLNTEALIEAELAELPEGEREAARAMFEGMLGAMQMSLGIEGNNITMTMTMGGESEERAGTWETVSEENGVLTIRTTMPPEEGSGEPEVEEGTVEFTDDGITVTIDGEAIMFTRAQ